LGVPVAIEQMDGETFFGNSMRSFLIFTISLREADGSYFANCIPRLAPVSNSRIHGVNL